ncbi:MAG TPA: NUDIX hydrolase, partial [Candidatus Stackebrandtia faecavium]|nr:NUDIX hydrolase [Candidatus Stackebrandtia faecavium]
TSRIFDSEHSPNERHTLMQEQARERVAVYVTRQGTGGTELLLFGHVHFPEVGWQVPAGGVDPGETLDEAAYREVYEETGLRSIEMQEALGIQQVAHPVTGKPRVTVFFAASSNESRSQWTHTVDESTGDDSGLVFKCKFVPIDQVALDYSQDQWLHLLRQRVVGIGRHARRHPVHGCGTYLDDSSSCR